MKLFPSASHSGRRPSSLLCFFGLLFIIAEIIVLFGLTGCHKDNPSPQHSINPAPTTDQIDIQVDGTRDSIQMDIAITNQTNVSLVTVTPSTTYTRYEAPTNSTISVQCGYLPTSNWSDTMRIIIRVNGTIRWSAQGTAALIIH